MDYAIKKKITLVGPSMLYFALKTVEYFWKTEKQSKNVQSIIELANKVSSQSIEIYESAQSAHDSVEKSIFVEAINFVDRALIYPCLYFLHR